MTVTEIVQITSGFVGSIGFATLFNIRGKKFIAVSVGGLISWFLFVVLSRWIPSEPINYFVVACSISAYSEIMAIVLKTPAATFVTTSLIPLIPGGSLYYTMSHAFSGNSELFLQKAISTLKLSAALALGIIISSTCARLLHKALNKRAKKATAQSEH